MLNWNEAVRQSADLALLPQVLNEVPLGALPLSGGLTNRAWRVCTQSHGWVIWRANSPHCVVFDVCRSNESAVIENAHYLIDTNQVIAHSSQGLVLSWLEGEPLAAAYQLEPILETLAKIHRTVPVAGIRQFDYQRKVDHYWQQLKCADIKSRYTDMYQQYRTLPRLHCRERVLCHFDFGVHNLLQTDRGLAVIDWEYAAVAAPTLDLVMTLDMLDVDIQTGLEIYQRYQPHIDFVAWQEDMEIWQRHAQVMASLWYLLAAQVWNNDDFLNEANAIYQRFC